VILVSRLITALGILALVLSAQPAKRAAPKKKSTVVSAPAAPAAPATSPDGPFLVDAVRIKGNRTVKNEQVIAYSGVKPGDTVKPAQLDAAMQRLLASGYFDRAGFRYEPSGTATRGIVVEWDLVEVNVFYPIIFEDLPIKGAEARDVLKRFDPLFGDQIPATREVLARYETALNDLLQPKEDDDRVRATLAPNDRNEMVITFRPRRQLPTIYSVDFRGMKLIPPEELRSAISGSAIGLAYRERDFQELLQFKIGSLYEARGRLRVKFPEVKVAPSKKEEVNGLDIVVRIEEGDEYNLGEIRMEGMGGDAGDWLTVGSFRQGVVVNMSEVDEGRRKMEAAVKRSGYLDVRIATKRFIDDKRKAIDLEFTIEPGERYTFGKLIIKGLDLISEPVVRKMWSVQAGDFFNPEYPDVFLQRLRDDGIFDNLGETKSSTDINRATRVVDVTLQFKGAPPVDPKKRRPGGLPPL
jgi:outer membrane protein insertion porin family